VSMEYRLNDDGTTSFRNESGGPWQPSSLDIFGQSFRVELIAGGVVKDADGNVIDDSSERAAKQRMAELGLPNLIEGTQ